MSILQGQQLPFPLNLMAYTTRTAATPTPEPYSLLFIYLFIPYLKKVTLLVEDFSTKRPSISHTNKYNMIIQSESSNIKLNKHV